MSTMRLSPRMPFRIASYVSTEYCLRIHTHNTQYTSANHVGNQSQQSSYVSTEYCIVNTREEFTTHIGKPRVSLTTALVSYSNSTALIRVHDIGILLVVTLTHIHASATNRTSVKPHISDIDRLLSIACRNGMSRVWMSPHTFRLPLHKRNQLQGHHFVSYHFNVQDDKMHDCLCFWNKSTIKVVIWMWIISWSTDLRISCWNHTGGTDQACLSSEDFDARVFSRLFVRIKNEGWVISQFQYYHRSVDCMLCPMLECFSV